MSARRAVQRIRPVRAVLAAFSATALALAGPAIGRLGPWSPPVAVAVDDSCAIVQIAIAYNDPSGANAPYYRMLEDGPAIFVDSAHGIFANDVCWYPLTDIGEGAHSPGVWSFGGAGEVGYAPVQDFNGEATYQYNFTGPYGQSNNATITMTVVPVNDEPGLASKDGCNSISVNEDFGPVQTCAFFGTRGGGGTEESQLLTGHASTDHPELFSAGPTLVGTGTTGGIDYLVSFTTAPNANGTAVVTLWVTDNGGTANGGVDTSKGRKISVTIVPVDDPPNAVNDAYATAFGQALVVPSGSGVLHNDTDVDGPAMSASKVSGPGHGVVLLQSDGSFIYTPTAGFSGKDSFTYRATSAALSDSATVSLTVAAPGATVPPTAPPAAASSVPGASPIVGVSPPATSPAAGESVAASLAPEITAAVASPTTSPAASAAPVMTTGGGSDLTPWLILLLVVITLVVGGNVAYARYLRSRRAPPPK